MGKSSLLSIDAFAKTEEDVRIRTKTGGIITIGCIFVTFLLLINEWTRFNKIVQRPQLVLDRDRQLKLHLELDITFPQMPCGLLNLDIVDDSGEIQLNLLDENFVKTRLDSQGKEISTEKFKIGGNDKANSINSDDENYCGSCYGAKSDDECCQTCEDVRQAYAAAGWEFFDGALIKQCEEEGYVKWLNDQLDEGCRISGHAKLNRIHGNIHFAPGQALPKKRSFLHAHDTSFYDKHPSLTFNHIISRFSFGPPTEGQLQNSNPLELHSAIVPDGHSHSFSYFTKVVPTRYEYLNGTKLETAQYSVSAHDRPLRGGKDEDHPKISHSSGGIAGVFINFEISPLKVINKEEHMISWSGFVLNCITSIGGVLAVGTVLDKITYKAQRSIWGKKSK